MHVKPYGWGLEYTGKISYPPQASSGRTSVSYCGLSQSSPGHRETKERAKDTAKLFLILQNIALQKLDKIKLCPKILQSDIQTVSKGTNQDSDLQYSDPHWNLYENDVKDVTKECAEKVNVTNPEATS